MSTRRARRRPTGSFPWKFFTVLLLAAATHADAQDSYPSKTITLIVPFAAGSGTDNVARIVSQRLSERLKQPVIVDNRAGANGQIAAEAVARAKPDGYTLFMTTNTTHSANPSLYKTLRYDPIKDFTPVIRTGELAFAVAVNNDLPVTNMKELIEYAKAHPGKISYGTPNSTSLVASETLKRQGKIDITSIPYKSSPQAMTDLIGNQIQLYVVDFGSGMSMLKANRVRAIAVTPARGSKIFPMFPRLARRFRASISRRGTAFSGPRARPRASSTSSPSKSTPSSRRRKSRRSWQRPGSRCGRRARRRNSRST